MNTNFGEVISKVSRTVLDEGSPEDAAINCFAVILHFQHTLVEHIYFDDKNHVINQCYSSKFFSINITMCKFFKF